ncbi:type II restriction endonuclease subunit R [Candidatus Desantisbacteria bacterium CG1_02_38_46]|uniref:Type II restriction endonuclease subunit R n=3 Tax=unclassified Candidatus Desantisiibacteriota TaxID=3106372 RepID=A0A2H9PCM7_9BACT|nr:MAG: type II restriction endonuclease subunit R [Candidatus Desantisbacteria bacterium CG1_02_38_46]PIU50794.1 MAG: type II restriction endonuclease subunit R [Candidatus Desantisbacteria bacterium CG07_land_8_20_14_0_80_39_15]PIZ17057.1 MAG: type II restriction endonuclease subunit R [Candidatus Desantisbacteria bacterium CG_4_10_14_0_8_um_filter_39_17]
MKKRQFKKCSNKLTEIFNDEKLVNKIKVRLPYLFQLAELESSRADRIGMEVGSLREKIIIALLIYKFGEENVETEIPITEPEIDVKLFGAPISIKTITKKKKEDFGGVKISWTVDTQKSREFLENYQPTSDILFVLINWDNGGGLYYIPVKAQKEILRKIEREDYIKLPKPGTNPRGVEITKKALIELVKHRETRSIEIDWKKTKVDFNPYKRWVDYWKED